MSKKEKNGISKHTDQKDREQKIEQRSAAIEPEQLDTMPGKENQMETKPIFDDDFPGMQRLLGKVALITGGDSGIGRAVAVAFAKEKAKVVIVYLSETKDANDTKSYIEGLGGEALLIKGDIGDKQFCQSAIEKTMSTFGQLDILVNNAGEQHPQDEITDITPQQLQQTFRTNIFGMFYMVQAALEHLEEGASIINTASITAYEGNKTLLDYAATKGAITSFTRSLAVNLAPKKIRVNQVAPGPIWTPLIPSTFSEDHVDRFGENTLMQRAAQPVELAEAYIFFAWGRASSYVTGQTIHVNGGRFRTS
ncbi:MAG: SDR family oxidoreductase [Clostridiales bacterium]|nr:SDR family oxidoreductase [Clostridiales bacterium]